MKKQQGFTLVEMLLAMALFALVMAAAYSAISVGLKAREQHNVEVQQNARAALEAISTHLRSAFLVQGAQAYYFNGGSSSISFFTFPPDAQSPVRIEYYIGGSNVNCAGLCRKTYSGAPDSGNSKTAAEEPVAPEITDLKLSYSADGENWLPAWNSPAALPRYVRITVSSPEKHSDNFETQVNLPLSYADFAGGPM